MSQVLIHPESDTFPDVEAIQPAPEAGSRPLVVRSYGLTEMVPDAHMAAVLQKESDPSTACERLVAEANAQGGKDNITVIVARFEPPS